MRYIQYALLAFLWLQSSSLLAAPLNKFGTMSQQAMPPPMQQQALFPSQEQQRIPSIHPAYKQARPAKKKIKKKHLRIILKIKSLLAKLPIKKVQSWQRNFEQKRDHAMDQGKKSVVDYYEHLIDLCKKSLAQRNVE
ncbi:MAG: hypothetical protein Q9M22_05710 [Mariprofundaceae bacterium]|nr:hypothetical protein [Mariprofundaceae bacterium]